MKKITTETNLLSDYKGWKNGLIKRKNERIARKLYWKIRASKSHFLFAPLLFCEVINMAEIPINYLKYIDQDGTEKKVYPITVTDAVYDSDGNKLSNVLLGVLKDTDISNVQSDITTTVPSSALLKSTYDKIGDTSSLPGDAGNVVSAINQLNSDFQNFHFVTNADLPWLSSGIRIETLNSPSQLTQPGPYTIISMSSNVNSNIESGGTQMTDYSIGDFSAILLSNSITQTNGCRYGILIVTTPRTGVSGSWVIWIGRIWDYKFTNWKQI